MDGAKRKIYLKSFATTELKRGGNRAHALVNIVRKAAIQVKDSENPSIDMIDDLEQVLVGTSMTNGRGKGQHFVGNYLGSQGFKPKLQDNYNQVQHAMAGIIIGFRYGIIGQWGAMWFESEPQDDNLYNATCPLGRKLDSSNYQNLAKDLCAAISNSPCQ